jgi:hypothetical protein
MGQFSPSARQESMTNRRDFLRTSGLMVAAAAVTGNPPKEAEAAIFDETQTDDFIERVVSFSRSSRRS